MARVVAALVLLLCAAAATAELVGCDGFVRLAPSLQGPEADLTAVEVRLETAGGAVVERTACAPNGYFFLPVYQAAASLRLVVAGPAAWYFEEEWVAAEVADGACNGGAEAHFEALGLAVAGRLLPPDGCGGGAAGVEVELAPAAGGPPAATAAADAEGAFRLGPVQAGHFLLRPRAGPQGWRTARADVHAHAAGVRVEGQLAMAGLAVEGAVRAAAAPLEAAGLRLVQEGRPHALARTDADGRFRFEGVACGPFRVEAADAALRLAPAAREGSLAAPGARLQPFDVEAFEARGAVADLAGAPVAGARVLADGLHVATSGADGTFAWTAAVGRATLEARAEGLRWEAAAVDLAPQRPPVQLAAAAAEVRGHVEQGGGRRVLLLPAGQPQASAGQAQAAAGHEARADADGAFSLWAAAGAWEARVEATAEDEAAGLRFEPARLDVRLEAGGVAGLRFARSALGLSGRVACDGPCAGVRLALERLADGAVREAEAAADGAFSFAGLVPGSHRLRVSGAGRCWAPEWRDVDVAHGGRLPEPAFGQDGWAAPLLLPRAMALRATHEASGAAAALEAGPGAARWCLPAAGAYLVEPEGRLRFAAPLRFHTAPADAAPLAPAVAEAELRATVLLPAAAAHLARDVALELQGPAGGRQVAQAAAAPQDGGGVRLSFLVWAAADGGGMALVPRAADLLFQPAALDAAALAAAAASPDLLLPPFAAAAGEFLAGHVRPAQADVEVVVRGPGGAVAAVGRTDADGAYRVGPLAAGGAYSAEARAAGFSFAATDGGFRAQRLGGLRVAVADEAGAAVPGVLLSLTGAASFRLNSETDGEGAAAAADLAPGAYHLRPLLKEYAFEPAAASVDVREGEQAELRLRARRVAYSAFGAVRSLAGAPERQLAVEAAAAGGAGAREEAQTDADGAFRLRGLAPAGSYVVRPLPCARVAAFVPPARSLDMEAADAEGLLFLALRAPGRLDVAGAVRAPAEHLHSLTVRLYAAGGEEVASAALAAVPLFSFTGLPKGAYRLEVTSSLSPAIFAFAPAAAAVPETVGSAWVDLAFPVQDRALAAVEQSSAASFLLLVLLSAAAAAAFHRRELVGLAARMRGAGAAPAPASANDYIPAEQRRQAARKQRRSHK